MIAGVGLSGGISSTIAGGDFWQGMRQGLITSGLNHAMHMGVNEIDKARVDKRLRAKGYEPNDAAEDLYRDHSKINDFAANVIPEYYDAAKRPDFVVDNTIESNKGQQSVGKVGITYDSEGNYSLTDGKVRLRSTVFNTYRGLTLTMIHELSHVIDVVSELRAKWHKKYDVSASYHMSEVKAYQLEMSWGNSYIKSNPIYLNHLNAKESNNWQF
ncbi:hypothetical protein [Myroides odoratus]|uniref:hypothetical protein n=1 Tax=Myroides odoratus TaxID=256 RepID=UPI00334075D1